MPMLPGAGTNVIIAHLSRGHCFYYGQCRNGNREADPWIFTGSMSWGQNQNSLSKDDLSFIFFPEAWFSF